MQSLSYAALSRSLIRSVSTWFRASVPLAVLLLAASGASADVVDFTGLGTSSLRSGEGYHTSVAAVLITQHGQDQMTSRVSEPSSLLLLGAVLTLVARRARRVQSAT